MPGTEQATIRQIKALYEQLLPGYPFEFSFMDDDYQALYESENRIAVLSGYLGGIAIIISCLGLFGLTNFTVYLRLKEIGIRKVLGSSVLQIIWLLTGSLSKTVIYAMIIGLPVSYFLMSNWLDDFAYQIDLGWGFFMIAGVSTLLVAWITASMNTIKVALANPVHFLRND